MALAHGLVPQNCTADYLSAGLLVGAPFEPRSYQLTIYRNPIISFVRLAYLIKLGPKIHDQDITCGSDGTPQNLSYG